MKQLITLILSSVFLFCNAQNTMTLSHEINLSPGFVLHGEQLLNNHDTYNELGSGYDISFGYTANFGWVGMTFQYYYRNNAANIDEMQSQLAVPEIESGNYSSNGFMTGIVVNIPLSETENHSFVDIGFTGGMFVAHLPEQTFTTQDESNFKYVKAQSPGFCYRMQVGYKHNFTDKIGISANLAILSERAAITRASIGDDVNIQYYDWKFDFPELKIGFHYNL